MDFDNFDVFSDKAEVADADRVLLLDPDQLYPDPENVRRDIDPATINEMAGTIEARGQLQPVTVAPKDEEGRYRIQFGERRWRACKQLGIKVRAIVAKADDPRRSASTNSSRTISAKTCRQPTWWPSSPRRLRPAARSQI